MSEARELEGYFADAASWDADRVAQTTRTLRIAWSVACAGWVCALVATVAVALLSPLKTVTPYLIRVDNTTGLVDVVPQYAGESQLPETITRNLLRSYVETCEGFVWATAEADYEDCGAFNAPRLNQAWAASWATSNPSSPLNRYKDGSSVLARVVSISFFERASGVDDLAQVRYVKARRSLDGHDDPPTHWIATIQYAYVTPSKDARLRQRNPLGFRVMEFRPEPETTPEAASATGSAGGRAAQ